MAVAEHPVEAQGIRKLTVDDVIRMSEVGILGELERVELVDGQLIEMSPESLDHVAIITWLNGVLVRAYPEDHGVRVQATLPLATHTYVLPDLHVVRVNLRTRFPVTGEVIVAIEVAVTGRRWDLGRKARLYAEWGAREYWVVDVTRGVVVVHGDPGPDGYATVRSVRDDEPMRLPETDRTLTPREILRA
jgi:Uma2 family endonuclease